MPLAGQTQSTWRYHRLGVKAAQLLTSHNFLLMEK